MVRRIVYFRFEFVKYYLIFLTKYDISYESNQVVRPLLERIGVW